MFKINKRELFKNLPDGILFDTDNTLYSYEPAHKKAMDTLKNKISNSLNVKVSEVETNFERAKKDVKANLRNTAASHSRLLYVQRMLEFA